MLKNLETVLQNYKIRAIWHMYTKIMEIVLDNSQIFKLKRRIYICTNHTAKLKGAEKLWIKILTNKKENKNYYMNNYMNYIMQNITKTNHNTYGGYLTEYDFDTDHPNGHIVENIISDWIFDKECKENTEARERRIKHV